MNKPWFWFLTIPTALLFSSCGFIPGSGNVIRGSGRVATETREVRDFDEVDVCCGMQLILSQDQAESLEIEAEDNILPEIVTEVFGGRLSIHFDDSLGQKIYRLTRPVRINLSVIDVRQIVISGGGSLEAGSIQSDNLSLELSGGSRAELEQVVGESLEAEVSGGGRISAQDLQTSQAVFDLSGGSHVDAGAITGDRIELEATGGGEVEIAGSVAEQSISLNGGANYNAGDLESQETEIRMNGGGRATIWVNEILSANLSGGARVEYYGKPQVSQNLSGGSELVSKGDR